MALGPARAFVALLAALLSLLLALGLPQAARAQLALQWPELRLTLVINGLEQPVAVAHAVDGTGRLFIVEQPGRIRLLKDGLATSEASWNLS